VCRVHHAARREEDPGTPGTRRCGNADQRRIGRRTGSCYDTTINHMGHCAERLPPARTRERQKQWRAIEFNKERLSGVTVISTKPLDFGLPLPFLLQHGSAFFPLAALPFAIQERYPTAQRSRLTLPPPEEAGTHQSWKQKSSDLHFPLLRSLQFCPTAAMREEAFRDRYAPPKGRDSANRRPKGLP
jgi:hypothetical protein